MCWVDGYFHYVQPILSVLIKKNSTVTSEEYKNEFVMTS